MAVINNIVQEGFVKDITHEIEINGIKGTLLHWSKVYGFAPTSASKQLKKGRSIESIIDGSKKRREAIDRCKNKILK